MLLPLTAAWVVTYFAPGVWDGIKNAAGQEPLTVVVLNQDQFSSPIEVDLSGEFVVPIRLSGWDPPDYPLSTFEWAHGLGGADANNTGVRLIVTGTTDRRVTIHDVQVRVMDRREPLRGLHVTGEKGAPEAPRYLRADLDDGTVSWSDENGEPIDPLTLSVDSSEQEILDLVATTEECLCLWVIALTYTWDGETRTTTVPKDGRTFRTTATSRAATYVAGAPTCSDFADLQPTLCDGPPPGYVSYDPSRQFAVDLSRSTRDR